MRKDFYLFRHGETDCNAEGRIQGCGVDAPLNATGIAQAEELAEKLALLDLEVIYSSKLKRARKTAQICADKFGIPVIECADLREACFGKAEGMLKEEMEATFPEIIKIWYDPEGTLDIRFPEGETNIEIKDRMLAAMDEIAKAPYTRIGIASHGSSLRYLLHFYGQAFHKIPNAHLFHLIWEDSEWLLSD